MARIRAAPPAVGSHPSGDGSVLETVVFALITRNVLD